MPCLVFSVIVQHTVSRGVFSTVVIYDQAQTGALDFIKTFQTEYVIYLVGVSKGRVRDYVCTQSTTTQLIVAPRGCDALDETVSVLRTNCGQKTEQGLQTNWFRHREDSACLSYGSEGTCLGPVIYFSRDQHELSSLAGAGVASGVGPDCAVPAMTKMRIQLPFARVSNSTCLILANGDYDADRSSLQQKLFIFLRGSTALYVERRDSLSYDVRAASPTQEESFLLVTPGQLFANSSSCVFMLEIVQPATLSLADTSMTRTASNYYKVLWTDSYDHTAACSIGVGRLLFDSGRSYAQGIAENVPFGGIPVFATRSGAPILVEADPRFADFDGDCDRFYPRSATFLGYGFNGTDGPEYDRSVPAMLSCFAPFFYVEKIREIGTLDERAKQCTALGGVLSSATSDLCAMNSWRTYCKKGWLYFDDQCWFKFDAERDSAYKQPQSSITDRTCTRLNEFARAVSAVSLQTSAWLRRHFVYWRYPSTISRVVVSAGRCECYSAPVGVEACNCQTPNFPLCVYHRKDVPLYWDNVDFHPRALSLLANGQQGVPRDGSEVECECLAGSSGKYCQAQTCPSPIIAASALNTSLSNPLLLFWKKCYAHKRGVCVGGDPNTCECSPGFGPRSSLSPDIFSATPCMCPALQVNQSPAVPIIISGAYSLSSLAVCGGVFRGACIMKGYNEAECICTSRLKIGGGTEAAFNGKSCSCPSPHFRKAGSVVETECNARGTCCPHGDTVDKRLKCTLSRGDGCFCEDGYTGAACTARVPKKLTTALPVLLHSTYSFAGHSNKEYIFTVWVIGSPHSTGVYLSDVDTETTGDACVEVEKQGWEQENPQIFLCNTSRKFTGVQVFSLFPSALEIKTFGDRFSPGGYHVNVFGPRFMSTPLFRSNHTWGELGAFKYTKYGVTNADVSCAAGYAGSICSLGVSSFQLDESTAERTPRLCGESTQPPRGKPVKDSCECETIGLDIFFTGDSCECAVVRGALCGGTGKCIAPSFPYGTCASDKNKNSADLLRSPSNGISVPVPAKFTLETASIVYIESAFWYLPPEFYVLKVQTRISYCPGPISQSLRFELSTLVAMTGAQASAVVIERACSVCSNTTTYTLVLQSPTSLSMCVDGTFSGAQLRCMLSIEYTANLAVLDSGYFEQALFVCVDARSPEPTLTPYMLGDCSDPVVRILRDALESSFISHGETECPGAIGYASNAMGLGYGLFVNLTRGVDFRDIWTSAHYSMLAGILKARCEDFTEKTWFDAWGAFVHSEKVPEATWGEEFKENTYAIRIRALAGEIIPHGLIISDSTRSVCASYLAPISDTLVTISTLSCEGYLYIYRLDGVHPTANVSYYSQEESFMRELKNGLAGNQFNASSDPFAAFSCENAPLLDIELPAHQDFLRQKYSSVFAPRYCTKDSECLQFEQSACVFPDTVHVPWLNGDDSQLRPISTYGHEGGCDCSADISGFFSPQLFCAACVEGYGPDTVEEIHAIALFSAQIQGWIDIPMSSVVRCSLPRDSTSSRVTDICGGKGYVVHSNSTDPYVAKKSIGGVIRGCSSLVVEGVEYQEIGFDLVSPEIHSYVSNSSSFATIIYGAVYVGGLAISNFDCVPFAESISGERQRYYLENGSFVSHIRRDPFTFFVSVI